MAGPSYASRAYVEEQSSEESLPPLPPPEVFTPAHVGGGWYELSDGSRVQGKEEAVQAQANL